jgi:hypothetical protein
MDGRETMKKRNKHKSIQTTSDFNEDAKIEFQQQNEVNEDRLREGMIDDWDD